MFEVDIDSNSYNDIFEHLYEKGFDSATCHKIASDMYLDEMAKEKAGDFETFTDWFGDKLTENFGANDFAIIHFTKFRYANSKSENN